MDKITKKEIKQLSEDCLKRIKSNELYQIRNDAKLRLENNTKCYEEFKWVEEKLDQFWDNFNLSFSETLSKQLT